MGKRRYRAMQYVYKRSDGHWQYRYPIPSDVSRYYPTGDGSKFRTHFVGSLGTPDRDEACRRAVLEFAKFERKFSMLRDGVNSPHFVDFFKTVFEQELELGRTRRATSSLSLEELDFELRTIRNALERPKPGELQAVAGWVVDHYFAVSVGEGNAQVPSDTKLHNALLSTAAGVLLDVYTQLAAEARGMAVAPMPRSPILAEIADHQPVAGENLALSPEGRLPIHKYWDVHAETKQSSSSPIAEHTLMRRRTAWKELCELLGNDTKMFRVTKADIWRYRDALMKAPARAGSNSALKGLTFPQRVEAMSLNPGKYQNLDLNSIGDRLRQINAVFQLAVTRGHLERNPVQGVHESKKSTERARRPYSADELNLIFTTSPFDRPVPLESQTDEYWVPLLQLFLGARASELYLRTQDVVLDHEVPHLRLVEYEERSLKNASSARALPVHPQLIELGFLDYCRLAKSRGSELFPMWEFRKGQKPSEGAGRRRFNRHLRRLMPDRGGVPADSHTFRHNFESALTDARVGDERILARLSGRAHRSSAATYIHDCEILPSLAFVIAKVGYPRLSLSHLVVR